MKDRKRGQGMLLMETERDINDEKHNALVKAQAVHPKYGKVKRSPFVNVQND